MNQKNISKTSWKPKSKRFVAYIDIMGFKDTVMRREHDEIYSMLEYFSKMKSFLENMDDGEVQKHYPDSEIYIVNFSDSIVVFSKNDTVENFTFFLHATAWLVAKAIENNIPLKGAISHGLVSVNKSSQIYFGQPLIDAYLLEEEVKYYGVVCHDSIDMYIHETKFDFDVKWLFSFITPLKCGQIKHMNLNWFRHLSNYKESKERKN